MGTDADCGLQTASNQDWWPSRVGRGWLSIIALHTATILDIVPPRERELQSVKTIYNWVRALAGWRISGCEVHLLWHSPKVLKRDRRKLLLSEQNYIFQKLSAMSYEEWTGELGQPQNFRMSFEFHIQSNHCSEISHIEGFQGPSPLLA